MSDTNTTVINQEQNLQYNHIKYHILKQFKTIAVLIPGCVFLYLPTKYMQK